MVRNAEGDRDSSARALLTTVVVALAVVVALVACAPAPTSSPSMTSGRPAVSGGPTTGPASVAPSVDPITVYGSIATDVEAIRGLEPTKDVRPVLVDEARLRANVSEDFDRTHGAASVEAKEHLLVGLGLLSPGISLRQTQLDLLGGQVAGYYDPEKDQLFVVSRTGGIGPTQRSTYAHEFTHELQDQHFDLGKLGLETPDQTDRSLARLALVEGDASSAQTRWMTQKLSPADLAQLIADASDPAALAALAKAPAYLRETSLFPYQDGLAFVASLMSDGTFARVNAAFAEPPDSTEQILHPQKYAAREAPIAVEIPTAPLLAELGTGWKVESQDTLGELMLRIWIRESRTAPTGGAATAAAGWGGDRVAVVARPDGSRAVILDTVWDTAADASEFAAAAAVAVPGHHLDGDVSTFGSTRVVVVLGGDARIRAVITGVLAR